MQQAVPAGSRRDIRRAVRLSVEVVSERCETPFRFIATDLSPGGIWLQTADPVRAGETCVVCFEPEVDWSGGELMVFAEVARVATTRRRQYEPGVGMGLEFIDLHGEQRDHLANWLQRRRSPVPRRRRPVRRFNIPEPTMTREFDEVRGTTGVQSVAAPSLAAAREEPTQQPLKVCWR
jgi:hypothetical protein